LQAKILDYTENISIQEVYTAAEGHFLKEPYSRHFNEASERRKKKDLLFEERSDEFVFFPKREDEQKQSKADIQRQRGKVPRYLLTFILNIILYYIAKRC